MFVSCLCVNLGITSSMRECSGKVLSSVNTLFAANFVRQNPSGLTKQRDVSLFLFYSPNDE